MKGSNTTRINMLRGTLAALGLKYAAASISVLLQEADKEGCTPVELLLHVTQYETSQRLIKRKGRNYAAAHFPPSPKRLDEYDTSELESGITPTQIAQLKDLSWADSASNILFLGPPGLGKTTLAVALGVEAVEGGYTVGFQRMSSLLDILSNAGVDRSSSFRLRKLKQCDVLIIDELGFCPITREQANLFFSLISDIHETTSIIMTTNKKVTEWAEFLGDNALATALLDRLLYNARCFSLIGESYRMKHPRVPEGLPASAGEAGCDA